MESAETPKSFLKPLTKIMKTETKKSKFLPTISEDKSTRSSTSNMSKLSTPAPKVHVKPMLRPRSKSASELQLIQQKPLTTRRIAALKLGQKRPALQEIDKGNKPKVPKVKIPDWDYKSRFQELQKEHTATLEENKLFKTQVSQLEEEIESLRNAKQYDPEKIEFLQKSEKNLQDSFMVVSNEKNSLIKEFANQKKEYQNLTDSYDNCQEKYNILLETEKNLKEKNRNLLDENSTLKAKLSNQESKFWLHTSFNTLEELTKECLQKISNTEKIPQEPALCNTLLENWCKDLENITLKLKRDLDKQDDPRRSLRNTIQDVTGNIRVFCRIRPPITSEENERQLCAMSFPNETSLEIRKARKSVNVLSGKLINLKQKFTFDKVFPPDVTQAEVFEELGQLVQSALDGYHVCVFAYGQPGSGKTYTMQGSSNDCGIIPRTIDLIFQKIDKLSTLDWNYSVTASFLELYNENIRDLLLPNSTHNYEVRYNEGHGITVTNLQIIPITSAEELKLLMEEAQKNRTVAATNSNEHSSRSHAITKIHLEGYNETSKVKYSGSIHLVDLAGSESARTTNAERLNETKNINTSLSALGNVMLALYNKHPHIPYRNSKLTFLLQSCLGGNSKTLMFVNVSPFEECFGESINSLRFASKIKEIKTVAKKNKTYAFQCYH